jgi:dUTP pyrophosphatase
MKSNDPINNLCKIYKRLIHIKYIFDMYILKIAICSNNQQLLDLYKEYIAKHNTSMITDPFPNSGFDLFVPDTVEIADYSSKMVSMDVKCEMVDDLGHSCAYYMYPRSSFSKTPLMLANHVGIIDSGYRGNLIGAFRNLGTTPFKVEQGTRLLQICHPGLLPVHVVLVDEAELSTTARGAGGFGSTGV